MRTWIMMCAEGGGVGPEYHQKGHKMRLPRKDQFDRSLINGIKVGSTFSKDWFTGLCKPVGKKLKRKLQRHGWILLPLHLESGPSFKVIKAEDDPARLKANAVPQTSPLMGDPNETFSVNIDSQL